MMNTQELTELAEKAMDALQNLIDALKAQRPYDSDAQELRSSLTLTQADIYIYKAGMESEESK